ncbi:MAG: Serine protease [uncultured Sulfurovum sp.]|uniref:Serine protease n=1 Tax=uncultured Sulfurovum sp. TaxID=269237 RepID=A0A6S6U1K6_9BACT|nr:MAG: Serine protease [uncultured Sulfurovum sp.]
MTTGKNQALKAYDNPLWGISLETKERLQKPFGKDLKFGIVITLKEINRINRIDDFIHNANLKGWLVNQIDVDSRVEIFNKAEEEIVFE